jgi:radical SAM protein with 4Fe4S-binding SPASM domain
MVSHPQHKPYFCILPWVHVAVMPNGSTYSCCLSDFKQPLGNINTTDLNEVWNGEKIKQLRVALNNGEKVSPCEYCYKREALGQKSLRQTSNEEWSNTFERINQMKEDGSLIKHNPIYLDLRFSNICNFKCRTCGPDFSSAWYGDYKKIKSQDFPVVQIDPQKKELLWKQLISFLPNLKKIYFAGGEPLIQEDHYRLLKELIKLGKTDIRLEYNTNLSVLEFHNNSVLELWNHFKDVHVNASLDGIGTHGEYIRHGLDWERFKTNRKLIKDKTPHVSFTVCWTLSVFNIFHIIPAIHFFIQDSFLSSGTNFFVNVLDEPEIYNARILDRSEREKVKILYHQFIDNFLNKIDYPNKEQIKEALNYILNYLGEDTYPKERKAFWLYTRQLDRLRRENFLRLFPELQNLMLEPLSSE